MSYPRERYAVVILSCGRVVRVLGRGYTFSMARAIVRSARRAPDADGAPAIVADAIFRALGPAQRPRSG